MGLEQLDLTRADDSFESTHICPTHEDVQKMSPVLALSSPEFQLPAISPFM